MRCSANEMQVFDSGAFDSEMEPTLGFDREEWTKACTELRRLRQTVKKSRFAQLDVPMGLTALHNIIPSQDVCDVLVANYMQTFGRIYRIINMPEFREELSQFWNDPKASSKVSCFPQTSTRSHHVIRTKTCLKTSTSY